MMKNLIVALTALTVVALGGVPVSNTVRGELILTQKRIKIFYIDITHSKSQDVHSAVTMFSKQHGFAIGETARFDSFQIDLWRHDFHITITPDAEKKKS
jgi:hypothetical protein